MSDSTNQPPKAGWNWWAFIFGPLWCFVNGLWKEGLKLFFGYQILAAMLGGLAGAISSSETPAYFVYTCVYLLLLYRWANGPANEARYIHWRKRQIELGNLNVLQDKETTQSSS